MFFLFSQELRDIRLRVPKPSCQHLQQKMSLKSRDLGHLDLNRFSDPLHSTSFLGASLGRPLLSQRTHKAHTWYLANSLPRHTHKAHTWYLANSLPRHTNYKAAYDDMPFSLFGNLATQNKQFKNTSSSENFAARSRSSVGQNDVRNSWLNRMTSFSSNYLAQEKLDNRYAFSSDVRFSSHCRTFWSNTGQKLSPSSCLRSSRNPSLRSGPSPNQVHSPGYLHEFVPQGQPNTSYMRTSYVWQWVDRSSNQLLPLPTRARVSTANSQDTDTSNGSETDDDFLYVSCRQLTKDIASLSVAHSETSPKHHNYGLKKESQPSTKVLENPMFYLPRDDDQEEEIFDGCSDDALSDDVFLDNIESPSQEGKENLLRDSKSFQGPKCERADTEKEAENVEKDILGNLAMESLRRSSIQCKWRKMWQNRRAKVTGRPRDQSPPTIHSENQEPVPSSDIADQHSSSSHSLGFSCQSPTSDDASHLTGNDGETNEDLQADVKSCYHYVISPTDDVNMPDVIVVRKSSVELLKWQNSLRRRRRRQAKRHDLGKSKKEQKTAVGTV